MINDFRKEYFCLSNFYICHIMHDGLNYTNVESAFQAAKVKDLELREKLFVNTTPTEAKRLGRKVFLREDWEQIKDQVMEDCIRDKFTKSEPLKQFLLNTGDEELVEGNTWGDKYWGVCDGEGQNKLGKLLMKIRDELNFSDN